MTIHSRPHIMLMLNVCFCFLFPTPALASSSAILGVNSQEGIVIIDVDYTNRFYKQVNLKVPRITVLRVNDIRKLDPGDINSPAVGILRGDKNIVLNVAVKDFIGKSFQQMLTSNEDSDRQLEVELNIEEFRLDQRRVSLLNNRIGFAGKISVTIFLENKRIEAGYIQNYADSDVPSNIKENLADLMYQGMTDMAQQLAGIISAEEIIPASYLDLDMKPAEEQELAVTAGSEFFGGITYHFHTFTEQLMEESYGDMHAVGTYTGYWFKNRMGYRAALTYETAKGIPARSDTSWDVTSSEIKMHNLAFEGTFLYSLRNDPTKSIFNPFVGVGLKVFLGAEKIGATASRTIVDPYFLYQEFAMHSWGLRASFASHALFGSRVRVTEKIRLSVEARWTQSGKGGTLELKKEEEMEFLNTTLFDAVRRSDFNFTGWSIHLGLEY